MARLVWAIHSSTCAATDGPDKPGHDGNKARPMRLNLSAVCCSLTSSAGSNTWTWNGKNASGTTMADGAYTVTVTAVGSSGTTTQVPFTVTGTATAVQNVNGIVKLQMGGLTVPFSNVVSVGS